MGWENLIALILIRLCLNRMQYEKMKERDDFRKEGRFNRQVTIFCVSDNRVFLHHNLHLCKIPTLHTHIYQLQWDIQDSTLIRCSTNITLSAVGSPQKVESFK